MSEGTISELTRRDIFDFIRANIAWSGRLSEVEFLGRLYDLESLPSGDHRFSSFSGDIWQHRVNNNDWDDDWVLTDPRLGLQSGPDEVLLAFLSEMFHPVVRPYDEKARQVLDAFNGYLAPDGWEIAECERISGRPVFAARRLLPSASQSLDNAKSAAAALGSDSIHRQITRMEASVQDDPELAIGTAKEFLETICRTILEERGGTYHKDDDLGRLVKLTLDELGITAEGVPSAAVAFKVVRRVLGGLGSVSQGLAELRNLHGTGHGRSAGNEPARPHYARLAVGAATTLGVFLFEAHRGDGASEEVE